MRYAVIALAISAQPVLAQNVTTSCDDLLPIVRTQIAQTHTIADGLVACTVLGFPDACKKFMNAASAPDDAASSVAVEWVKQCGWTTDQIGLPD